MRRNPGIPVEELVGDMGNDPDQVFTRSSLLLMRVLLLVIWLALLSSLTMIAALVLMLQSKERDHAAEPWLADLQARVSGLSAGVDDGTRTELEKAVQTLSFPARNFRGTILTVAPFFEGEHGLLGRIAAADGRKLKGHNLDAQIEELAARGLLPVKVASDLHWIRIRANKARHNEPVLEDDARTALHLTLMVLEWWYCECGLGPRIANLFARGKKGTWEKGDIA
jgi:hypothetical protein